VTSGVSRGLQMSETMRSVMVTSSVKALSRRLPEGEIQPPNQTKKCISTKRRTPSPEGVIRLPHGTNMYPKNRGGGVKIQPPNCTSTIRILEEEAWGIICWQNVCPGLESEVIDSPVERQDPGTWFILGGNVGCAAMWPSLGWNRYGPHTGSTTKCGARPWPCNVYLVIFA
jgi:hypothetical protein